MRRTVLLAMVLVVALVGVACGGDDDDATGSGSPTAPASDQEGTDDGASDQAGTDDDASADGAGATVDVALIEWAIVAAASPPAGSISFAVTNSGSFSHELVVARGTSYEDLPQLPNGAVDEAALGDDVIGRTEVLSSGGSATLTLDLEAGDYVLFCNIAVGPNSHAANGQVLSMSVG